MQPLLQQNNNSFLINAAGVDGDPNDKQLTSVPVLEGEESTYRTLKWVGGIGLTLLGIVLLVISFTTDHLFTLQANITRSRRTGDELDGALPAAVFAAFGTADVTIFFALASLFAGIGFFVLLFLNKDEIDEIARGSNGYMWATMMASQIWLFIGLSLVAGVTDFWLSTVVTATLVFAWLAIFWLGDIINQHYYTNAMRYFGYRFSWAFLVFAAVLFLVYVIMIIDHAIATFSGDASGPGSLLALVITSLVLYAVWIVFILMHNAGVSFIAKTIDGVTWLQGIHLAFVFVVSIFAYIVVAFLDGKIEDGLGEVIEI